MRDFIETETHRQCFASLCKKHLNESYERSKK